VLWETFFEDNPKIIGKGSFGETFLAISLSDNNKYVIKQIVTSHLQ